MKKEYIDPQDLRTKFRSKSDLWARMSVDMDILLPSYPRCPIQFMKQLLAGDKKFIKNKQAIYFEIPNYPELGVKHVWPLVKENHNLLEYFPDYKPSQHPEKEFMYAVLSTLKPDEVRTLVASSLAHRAPASQDDKDDLIKVTHELKHLITNLYSMKTTKGRANYPPKKSSILNAPRKNSKKYNADFSQILNYRPNGAQNEEEKEEGENEEGEEMQ